MIWMDQNLFKASFAFNDMIDMRANDINITLEGGG